MTKTTAMGHMPKPDDRAYWLRVFAGQAMQGMLANPAGVRIRDEVRQDQHAYALAATVAAVALLDAIDAHEKEAGNA